MKLEIEWIGTGSCLQCRAWKWIACLWLIFCGYAPAENDAFVSLFNGTNLEGWKGDPKLWKVEKGIIVGTCAGPDAMQDNSFLIWEGGKPADFELRATIRVMGDNNSGIQYRSRQLAEKGPWVISGYQCDVHPATEHTGMTYEEKGRGIFGLNGNNVAVDPNGARWLLSQHDPVKVDTSEWNEFTVIARGNHLIHKVNGKITSELFDYDEAGRALEGLLAIQLHRGNANRVEISEIKLKTLPTTSPRPFEAASLPKGATKIDKPRTSRPQGTGPVQRGSAKNRKAAKSGTVRPPRYADTVPEPSIKEISYGPHKRHILDFWKADSDQPTPLVFVIHGGGWQGGSKERLDRFVDARALLDSGISIAALNYRYVKQAVEEGVEPPVKAPLHDAARALQFVRSKAREWNLDKERIGAAGGSAGACSSLWLAFHEDMADPKSKDPISRESTRLWCAAVKGAQTSLDPMQMKEWTPNSRYGGHAFGLKNFAEFLSARERILPWIEEYSPYALVSKNDPPVYLIYGAPPALGQEQQDPTHTSNFGIKLREHCQSLGVSCDLVYPGAKGVVYAGPTDFLIAKLKEK